MKKIFYLEDHTFYANVIVPELIRQGYSVTHALTYKNAEEEVVKEETYDFAILDVVLTNGKTGIHFAEKYKHKFGKMLFITGCKDTQTIETLVNKKWCSLSKHYEVIDDLKEFLENGKEFYISVDDAC
jgi:DNA-binding response OmpR family regulator